MKGIKDLLFEKNSLESEKEKVNEELERKIKQLYYIRSKENLKDIEVQNTATKLMDEIRNLEENTKEKQEKISVKENEIKEEQERRGEQRMDKLEKRYIEGNLDVVNLNQKQKDTLEKDLFISGLRSLGTNDTKPIEKYNEFRALTINGSKNNGGNLLVPKTLFEEIIAKAIDQSVIFSKISTTTIPGDFELVYDNSDVTLKWAGDNEKTEVTEAIKLTSIILKPKLVTVILEISKLLIKMTNFNIEDYITKKVSQTLAIELDKQIINGTGLGTPTGIITALGTAGKQVEIEMTYKDVSSKIRTALNSPYNENSKLYMNRDMLGMLDNIIDKNERPIFQTTGYEDTFNGRILNQPVILSSSIPSTLFVITKAFPDP